MRSSLVLMISGASDRDLIVDLKSQHSHSSSMGYEALNHRNIPQVQEAINEILEACPAANVCEELCVLDGQSTMAVRLRIHG